MTPTGVVYASSNFYFSTISLQYSRRIYSVFDVLGLTGGIIGAFTTIILIIIAPVAEFNFFMKMIQRLFLAKTNENIFNNSKNPKFERH